MDCLEYKFEFWHILLPPLSSVENLCYSYDKTKLFMSTFIRTILAIIILYYYHKFYKENPAQDKKNILTGLFFVTLSYIFIFILVLFKQQKYNKKYNKKLV